MSRGKRYNSKQKLNTKKVLAVIVLILVLILFVGTIKKLLNKQTSTTAKQFAKEYFTVYTEGKWGVIDSSGEIVINPEYDEMIVIPDNTKPVFICTYDVNYENETYSTKAINQKNEVIFKNYEKVEALQNYDEGNNLWYEEGILKVLKDGKYGLIDLDGKEILKCEYDEVEALKGITKSIITLKDGKVGLVDNTGSVIIENKYSKILPLTDEYKDGYIVEDENGNYGVINYNKTLVVECKYADIKNIYGNEMYVVNDGTNWKIVNDKGEEYLKGAFDAVKSINGNNVVITKGGIDYVLNLQGETVIPGEYSSIEYAFNDAYIVSENGVYGMVNSQNQVVVELKYDYISYRSDIDIIDAELSSGEESDLIDSKTYEVKLTGCITNVNADRGYLQLRIGNDYKYYNFKLEESTNRKFLIENTLFLDKKDGKYGYVDNNGVVVVDYIYDDATEQNTCGFVSVKKDGLWGCLNQHGQVLVEPKYAFENNIIVDFIGDWYLTEDLNAHYYTK